MDDICVRLLPVDRARGRCAMSLIWDEATYSTAAMVCSREGRVSARKVRSGRGLALSHSASTPGFDCGAQGSPAADCARVGEVMTVLASRKAAIVGTARRSVTGVLSGTNPVGFGVSLFALPYHKMVTEQRKPE
ncbi:hypothetical protein D3C80_1677830 [compost metagenome]